jgi:hypothetical protein
MVNVAFMDEFIHYLYLMNEYQIKSHLLFSIDLNHGTFDGVFDDAFHLFGERINVDFSIVRLYNTFKISLDYEIVPIIYEITFGF